MHINLDRQKEKRKNSGTREAFDQMHVLVKKVAKFLSFFTKKVPRAAAESQRKTLSTKCC